MHGLQRYTGRLWLLKGNEGYRTAKRIRRCVVNDAGGAIVEMALSSAILFAMFFGVFELSFASYTYHYVAAAAREGARFAIVRGSLRARTLRTCPTAMQAIQ